MTDLSDPMHLFQTHRRAPLRSSDWQEQLVTLQPGDRDDWTWDAQRYVAHPFVAEAVNVSIALGKPLLVTGEPGVGKTALANAIAWQLGLKKPEKFVAKSTSEANDLFYSYDALARLYAVEVTRFLRERGPEEIAKQPRRFTEPENPRHFIDYKALGRAILGAHPAETVESFLLTEPATGRATDAGRYVHPGAPEKSVVLIDEIDKASSDFCNDLLDEFDKLQFSVPEIGIEVTPEADRAMRPIVVVTSNRERELPPAFLRRCVYSHIPQPMRTPQGQIAGDGDYVIENILKHRLTETVVYQKFTQSVLDLAEAIVRRQPSKPPSTAELIELLQYCEMRGVDWDTPIKDQHELISSAICILTKTESDNSIARGAMAG